MVLLVIDAQRLITNEKLYKFHTFEANVKEIIIVGLQTDYCIDAIIKCGFEHGFNILVQAHANTTLDNEFMTSEQSYKYHDEFMWKGRYAECISIDEIIKRMRI